MAAALLLLAGMPAASQSRGEVSFYNRTLRKLTVKNANKFLEKYPSSVYRGWTVIMAVSRTGGSLRR